MLALVTACGRVGFDAVGGAADAIGDPPCPQLFCDGFESPTLAAWDGAEITGMSAVARDTTQMRTGIAALHVSGQTSSDVADQFVDVFPVVPPTDQRVRVFIYSPSSSALNCEPVALGNPSRNYQFVFSLYDTAFDIHAHSIAGGFNVTRNIAPPRDRWVCYELHVAIAQVGTVELFQDGTLVAVQSDIDTRPPGDLGRVFVGMPSKSFDTTEELWVDDVVADTAPIGCN